MSNSSQKDVTAFAPGKAIIIGDHSAVHGGVGLVRSLSLGVTVTSRPSNSSTHHFSLTSNLPEIQESDRLIKEYLAQLMTWLESQHNFTTLSHQKFESEIKIDIPVKYGIGSSTALAVACIDAWSQLLGKKLTKNQLLDLVIEFESRSYPVSGLDQTAIVYGGWCQVQKKPKGVSWKQIENETTQQQRFALVFSGQAKESTAEMVQLFDKNVQTQNGTKLLQKMIELSDRFVGELQQSSWEPELLNQFGECLIQMEMVGEKALAMIRALQKQGFVAKVTAGGGRKAGSGMILVWNHDITKATLFCESKGWRYLLV